MVGDRPSSRKPPASNHHVVAEGPLATLPRCHTEDDHHVGEVCLAMSKGLERGGFTAANQAPTTTRLGFGHGGGWDKSIATTPRTTRSFRCGGEHGDRWDFCGGGSSYNGRDGFRGKGIGEMATIATGG